jgi:hypothetical protein
MSEELENKAAEELAAEEAKAAAEKEAAENQKSEEEIAEEARLAEEEKIAAAKAAEEHKEKSKLGRRVSEMEDKMNDFLDKAGQILNQPQRTSTTSDLNEDDYMTVGSFKKLMQEQTNEMRVEADKKARQDMLYGRAYEKEINDIGDTVDDAETHLKVMKLITEDGSPFNKRSSKDPKAAAQINYNKALRSLSSKSSPQPKLKGDKKLPPAGDASKTTIKTTPDIKLDAAALEYMRITGMDEKEAKELMSK